MLLCFALSANTRALFNEFSPADTVSGHSAESRSDVDQLYQEHRLRYSADSTQHAAEKLQLQEEIAKLKVMTDSGKRELYLVYTLVLVTTIYAIYMHRKYWLVKRNK